MASQQSAGDFDIQFSASSGAGVDFESMNKNYYAINLDQFYTRDRTFDQIFSLKQKENKFQLPLINFTLIEDKLKDAPECDGVFPRWLANTRLVNPNMNEKYTTATAIIGDSRKERDIGVAQGFSTYVL